MATENSLIAARSDGKCRRSGVTSGSVRKFWCPLSAHLSGGYDTRFRYPPGATVINSRSSID